MSEYRRANASGLDLCVMEISAHGAQNAMQRITNFAMQREIYERKGGGRKKTCGENAVRANRMRVFEPSRPAGVLTVSNSVANAARSAKDAWG